MIELTHKQQQEAEEKNSYLLENALMEHSWKQVVSRSSTLLWQHCNIAILPSLTDGRTKSVE
jgi:hypothetical protein